jgi:RNA polymerase sigma factor (sigma-70 family)
MVAMSSCGKPPPVDGAAPSPLERLVVQHLSEIRSFVARRGRDLIDREDLDDLVQGVVVAALRSAPSFRYRGPGQLVAWLYLIAGRYLSERRRFWAARRRKGMRPLRITSSGSSTVASGARVNPPATGPGPSTVAGRREEIDSVLKAIAALSARDQEVLRLWKEGFDTQEMSHYLGISRDAAERARSRALERLRQALHRSSGQDCG